MDPTRTAASPLARRAPAIAFVLLAAICIVALTPFLVVAGSYLLSGAIHPSCTDADRLTWSSVGHFVALEPRGAGESGCSATFSTDASAREVLDHYERALRASGWVIVGRRDQDPEATLVPAPAETEPIPSQMPMRYSELRASWDGYFFTVRYWQGWIGQGQADGTTQWSPSTRVSVELYPTAG